MSLDIEALCEKAWGIRGQPVREEIVKHYPSQFSFRIQNRVTGEIESVETVPVFWSTNIPLKDILAKLKSLEIEYGINEFEEFYTELTFSNETIDYTMTFYKGKCYGHWFTIESYNLNYGRATYYGGEPWYDFEEDYEFYDPEEDIEPLLKVFSSSKI